MRNIRSIAYLASVPAALLATSPAQAEQRSGFANISVNYLAWNHTPSFSRDDFVYVELEGGSTYNWGELYGFIDLENVEKSGDRYSIYPKGQIRYYLNNNEKGNGWNLFAQVKAPAAKRFHEYSNVFGVGYNMDVGPVRFRPFIGALYTNASSGFAGWNGYQLGWAAIWPFQVASKSFSLSNWNEYDFARKQAYRPGKSPHYSLNGALALTWNVTKNWAVGAKYRYAWNTLGAEGLTDAYIATLRYNF
ncbi:outer membrane protein OmpK [Ralstonia sp. 25C]|uniref:outer membrane protein OmpK n=1 Tax=Ralstonia sp. 25C TaxID=3447363 RepID=UPI003F751EC4